jgi:hypothetical protein
MSGKVGILNVGAGDTKLVFDPDNPADCIRAARIVKDMLRRGYALLVDTGKRDAQDRPIYARAKDFDETKFEYVIADFDPLIATQEDANEAEPPATPGRREKDSESAAQRGSATPKRRGSPTKRVPAESVNVVAVSRTAGG